MKLKQNKLNSDNYSVYCFDNVNIWHEEKDVAK